MSLDHDILSILRTTEWKTTLAIKQALSAPPYQRRLLIATLHARLDTLANNGLAESRLRPLEQESPEVVKARGGRRAMEFRLTEDGLRAKNERLNTLAAIRMKPAWT